MGDLPNLSSRSSPKYLKAFSKSSPSVVSFLDLPSLPKCNLKNQGKKKKKEWVLSILLILLFQAVKYAQITISLLFLVFGQERNTFETYLFSKSPLWSSLSTHLNCYCWRRWLSSFNVQSLTRHCRCSFARVKEERKLSCRNRVSLSQEYEDGQGSLMPELELMTHCFLMGPPSLSLMHLFFPHWVWGDTITL